MSRQLPYHLRTTGAPVARPVFGDAKQLRDAGGIRIKQCPVTGGVPTSMTEASFKRACASHRRQTGKTSYNYQIKERKVDLSACALCKGKRRPAELTIITDEEVREMGKPARNMGKCQNCGESAMVTKNNGLQVCSSCSSIQAAVKNRLEAVANAARSLGKGEELLAALVPSGKLAIQVTSDLLQEISGLVGYTGEDPKELVAAVVKATKACASCDAESVLHEIREIVGYTPDMGDSGLADAVRAFEDAGRVDCAECEAANAMIVIAELVGKPGADPDSVKAAVRGLVAAGGKDCTNDEILLRDDLARACDMDQDYSHSWSTVVQEAIHELARLQDRRDYWCQIATDARTDRARLDAKLQDALGKLAVANNTICELSAKCDRLEAETAAFEAENTRLREQQPESIGLLDVALAVIREEPVPAGQIASLIEAARGRAV